MAHPIAFFAYKRPELTRKSITALQGNQGFDPSLLFVFCDGARRQEDLLQVEETRKVVKELVSSQSTIEFRDENWGLANSIISATTFLIERFGTVIVLEDDIITSPYFLAYMSRGLDLYADDYRVMQISGYMFPLNADSKDEAFFLPLISSWGWATWRRAWDLFDPSIDKVYLLDNSKVLRHQFDLGGNYPFYKMLCLQREKQIDSWAIRWYMSVFLNGGLTLFPWKSLVLNIGFDGSGTHCAAEKQTHTISSADITRFPSVNLNIVVTRQLTDHLRAQNRWWNKLWRRCLAKLSRKAA